MSPKIIPDKKKSNVLNCFFIKIVKSHNWRDKNILSDQKDECHWISVGSIARNATTKKTILLGKRLVNSLEKKNKKE